MGDGTKGRAEIFFGVSALWAYAVYARRGGIFRYLVVAILLALSLLAKPTLVTFPFLLLVLDSVAAGPRRSLEAGAGQ